MRIALSVFLFLAAGCNMELAKDPNDPGDPGEPQEQVISLDGPIVYYGEENDMEWKTYEGTDLHDLHNDCIYMWKIFLSDYSVKPTTRIDKAVITFDDITNTGNDGRDTLFINIVDVVSPPPDFFDHVTSMRDTFSTGNDNAFSYSNLPSSGSMHWTVATLVTTWHDEDGPDTTTNLRIELTPEALEVLNTYRSDNNWICFGLDPDSGPVREANRLYRNSGAHIELTFTQ